MPVPIAFAVRVLAWVASLIEPCGLVGLSGGGTGADRRVGVVLRVLGNRNGIHQMLVGGQGIARQSLIRSVSGRMRNPRGFAVNNG